MAGPTSRRKPGNLGPVRQENSLGANYVDVDGRVKRRSYAVLEKEFF